MMRKERRQLLDRCLIDLCREMEVENVLIYLQGKGIFTDAVVDKVLCSGSVTSQRAAVVRAVKSRGDRAFEAFFRALLHARQLHLAELLRPLVDIGVLQTL
ncbi:caspase recruitment domain protein [Dictyocaulus viviparus]|uniref:Caspase recruitment domain protein n=1 Tax=Dictyocaulus viviparus TaxID=29172 RepID=A0A0D8Y760_DICVI|nr:caspase recruitment domain protein [Dictyocaulus viviparus]